MPNEHGKTIKVWADYAEAWRNALKDSEHAFKYLVPLIGREFVTPDGKMYEKILSVMPDGAVEVVRRIRLDKPAKFVPFPLTNVETD